MFDKRVVYDLSAILARAEPSKLPVTFWSKISHARRLEEKPLFHSVNYFYCINKHSNKLINCTTWLTPKWNEFQKEE